MIFLHVVTFIDLKDLFWT